VVPNKEEKKVVTKKIKAAQWGFKLFPGKNDAKLWPYRQENDFFYYDAD